MRTIVLGDIHGRDCWKKIVDQDFDRVIFIGDYFDTHEDVTGLEQLDNFKSICEFKRKQINLGKEVILLIGNHDFHYFPEISYTGTSGYQSRMKMVFEDAINENRDLLQMCFIDENKYIYSHAGITKSWCANVDINIYNQNIHEIVLSINELFYTQPRKFNFYAGDRSGYGDNVHQSPIWVRPNSLYRDKLNFMQIIGHTRVNKIGHPPKNERRGFYVIDCLPLEYLLIDGKIEIKSVKE